MASDDETEILTAYHEAGHALMAVACGGRIVHVSITPPDDEGLARFGESIVAWPAAPGHQIDLAELKVSLAGPVAELTYDGSRVAIRECTEFAADWRRAWRSAKALAASGKQKELLANTEREIWGFFEDPNAWSATAAIADLLLAHDTIEHDEVEEVWDFWSQR